MIIIVLALILTKKVPMNFVMFVIPMFCALLLGFSIKEMCAIIITQFNSTMQSAGYLLLFGNIYFLMVNESGMFDVIVNRMISLLGKRMNVTIIIVMTTVIGAVGYLTANFSTVYLLCFPLMMPLYNKYRFDRGDAFYICQTACVLVGFLPWGIGVIVTATATGLEATELARAGMPFALCAIPTVVLQWIYFTIRHKKIHGTLGLPSDINTSENIVEQAEKPHARPGLFWVNLGIFLAVMFCLLILRLPAWWLFLLASIVTALLNYPQTWAEIWNKNAGMFFNVIQMLLAISVYLAVFNATPEGGVSMITALAEWLVGIVPAFLLRYLHVIFLLLCVVIIRFVPYQVFNAMYPVFIAVGASFGISALAVIAPFLCNLTFATSVTPFNSATYIGCNLLKIEDINSFCNRGVVIMSMSLAIAVFVAAITGVLVF